MNIDRRRKRQLRNIVSIAWCALELSIALLAFRGLGGLLSWAMRSDVVIEGVAWPDGILGGEESAKETEALEAEEDELVVCVDAGHGGKDNGTGYRDRLEKDDNLRLAAEVASYLGGKGAKVVMTRDSDVFLSLKERCEVANGQKADYFVSLHRNDGNGNGVETWIYSSPNEETVAMAEAIMENLKGAGVSRDRGIKRGTQKGESSNYYVNSHSDMPSCIVEVGFMNSAEDNALFDEKLSAYAAGIGDAVLSTYARRGEFAAAGGEQEKKDTEAVDTQDAAEGNREEFDLSGLSAESLDWGQGGNVDEENRPVGAVAAKEKYGKYGAIFLGDDDKEIYLTMDEGYEYGCTERILDTLKEKGVKATFFVTKPYAESEPELVRRMIDEGHVVGNHSVTHPAAGLPSMSIDEQRQEVMGNHEYVKEQFGYEMDLFRYPAGKFSEQSLALVANCGYKSVFWSFAYLDYDVENQPDPAESLQKMIAKLHPGAVYLLHAESETNTKVLGDFIDAAREAGYSFGILP